MMEQFETKISLFKTFSAIIRFGGGNKGGLDEEDVDQGGLKVNEEVNPSQDVC